MKKTTIAQQAGIIRRKLKRQGIEVIKDHEENEVPLKYIPNAKLVEHFTTADLVEEAKDILRQLEAFKAKVQSSGDEIYTKLLEEAGVASKEVKNFHIATLDRSMKIVFKRPPRYTQDEKELAISREFKKAWLKDEAENVPEYIIDLVSSLIEARDGNIDQSQISELNKLTDKIKNKNFQQMVKHFNKSLEAYYAKRYEQFIERNVQGEEDTYVLSYARAEAVPETTDSRS